MRFLSSKNPCLGIEIATETVRLAAVSGGGKNPGVSSYKETDLPDGIVTSDYSSLNIHDSARLAEVLSRCLEDIDPGPAPRAALSLPDGVFRVQVFEFDEFPRKAEERERLLRWRFEKSSFDVSESVIRYQVWRRQDKGVSVLACAAKGAVISQYEAVLVELGIEPWTVGISSLHVLNFYESYLSDVSPVIALARVSKRSCTTIIQERGARFYRYKEVKNGNAGNTAKGLVREIGDSLHFYTHRDRQRQNEVGCVYLTGDHGVLPGIRDGLRDMTSAGVEVLYPSLVVPSLKEAGPDMAAVMGAGCRL